MSFRKYAVWLASTLLYTRSGLAAKVSLVEALRDAPRAAPDVVLAERGVREAEARRVGAGVVLPQNPTLSLDVKPQLRESPVQHGYGATLSAPFELFGAPSARVREADRMREVAKTRVQLEKTEARARVFLSYVRTKFAEHRAKEARAMLDLATRTHEASRQRVLAGAAGETESALSLLLLGEQEVLVTDAEREREASAMMLRQGLDLAADEPLELTSELDKVPDLLPAQQLVTQALDRRPEFSVIRARLLLLGSTDDRLRKEVLPRAGFFAGVSQEPQSPMYGTLGAAIELPFAQRNQGPRALVRREQETERERLELEGRRVVREVLLARASVVLYQKSLTTLTDKVIPSGERTLELVDLGYRAGKFDIFRVVQAARDLRRVRAHRLDTLEGAWLAYVALDRASGGLAP